MEAAFLAGLAAVRAAGLPAKSNDIAVIAAYRVFEKHAGPKRSDPRFDEQAPEFAKRLIIQAFAIGG